MTEPRIGNYSSCCRLCLTDKFDHLSNIYTGYSDCTDLLNKILLLIGVQITPNDKLSTMLCEKCYSLINTWAGFKKTCLSNQDTLKKWLDNWSENLTNIQVKDEPIDTDEVVKEIISVNCDEEELAVKSEPADAEQDMLAEGEEEEYYDLPPPLTPHPPDDPENVNETSSLEADAELSSSNIGKRISSNHCNVCEKILSNPSNRKKHERVMHGLHGGKTKQYLSSSELVVNRAVLDDVSSTENHSNSSSPVIFYENSEQGTGGKTMKDQEKIDFAAGLCLQSKSVAPKQSQLTKIEQMYLEKCKVMISMFNTNICACHNQKYVSMKQMLGHLRQLYPCFPPYTCYNCLLTFDGRSSKMRHITRCPRLKMESLIRLSELRARTDDKIRLYQNFKCLECNFLFSFYEDYCDHVDNMHVSDEKPHVCVCMEQFENADLFRQHIHKSCYLNYYCDVCCVLTPSLEEFTQHCEESHDHEEDYTFLSVSPNFYILNNIEIANILLESKVAQKEKEEEKARKIEERKAEKGIEFVPVLEAAEETFVEPLKVLNPAALFSNKNQRDCGICGKTYSNYHNMIRHLKSFHGIDPNTKASAPICDVCGNEFSSYHNMLRHRKIHESQHSESPEFNENSEVSITKLPLMKVSRSSFRCDECGETFKNANTLEEHVAEEHTFACAKCGKEFSNPEDLEQHRSVHLNITLTRDPNTKNYHNASKICQICDKMFQNDSELEEHLLLHEKMPTLDIEDEDHKEFKQYKCDAHNKTYRSSRGLWGHNKKFHPEKMSREDFPKQCDSCERVLTTMSAWIMHKQMHDRVNRQIVVKPVDRNDDDSDYHTCKKCFKVFGNKYNLMKHMRCHGIHTSPSRTSMKSGKSGKTFWCNICHQGCPGLEELRKHKMEHKNEELSDGDVEIVDNRNMQIKTEPNTKPVKQVYCKYCKIPFNSVVDLNEHMTIEHEERKNVKQAQNSKNKFSCELCSKVFASSSALCSHQGWHKRGKVDRVLKTQKKMFKKYVHAGPQMKQYPKFRCPTCYQTFNDDTSLQLHVLEIHRNIAATIKKLTTKCAACNIEFTSQVEFEAHDRMHHRSKDIKSGVTCKFCQRVFSRSDYLNLHINKKHPEMLSSGLFKCTICDRVFEKQNALSIHLKVHERVGGNTTMESMNTSNNQHPKSNGVRVYKYSCSICHIGFDIPKDLRNHIISSHPF